METIINLLFNKQDLILVASQKVISLGDNHLFVNSSSSNWLQKMYKDSELQDFWSLLTSSVN